ncbi:MAG: response regulator, partial [Lachnospiraceae bacterium]|nr:response regulator [Lachnospiraceae bacterium]
ISKISQKKFQINKVPYSFGEFWEAVNMLIEPMCASKTVDFEWKSSIPEDYVVLTDPLRITQVFINLLSNAIKYTPSGGHISFECRQKELEGGNSKVTFIVKDDGIGMSDEFQKRMFEPFQQESKDVNSELNGTGLGLSIVKAIIDAMKGKITVNSAPGAGTTIKVVLDFEIAKDSPAHMIKYEDADLNGKRILVVEDNDINREIAVALLEKKGMIAETAVNGQDAMEKFSSHTPGHYDLILMDIRMPIMSGLKATKYIRAMERDDARQIPIIAMTANAFNKDVQASLDAGMNEHLSKPIEPRSLYNTIAKYVSKK